MLTGHDILAELERRGLRTSRLLYDEIQTLKSADTYQDVQTFFESKDYPITVTKESSAINIVDEMERKWKRDTKHTMLAAMFSDPVGIVIFGPLLLGYKMISWAASLFKSKKRDEE